MRRRRLGCVLVATALVSIVACSGSDPEHQPTSSWSTASPSPSASPEPLAPLAHGLGAAPQEPLTQPQPPAQTEPEPRPEPEPEPEPEGGPPPPPPRYEGECIAEYDGDARSQSDVAAALVSAGSRTYWPHSAPEISVPERLLRAIAWQESGWQTNVIACDGGVGLMQVMPGTATWMNDRFQQSYNINSYTDNAYLGGTYLAWLIKYLGDRHFDGAYSVAGSDCAGHSDTCLLNLVIASYNFGHGAVEDGDDLVIPNPGYVDSVRSLMDSCECLSY